MKFYHRTTSDAAATIIATGFRDETKSYMTESNWSGVWLSDRPLDDDDGWHDALLLVDCDFSDEFAQDFEWIEDGKPYREWLVPAKILNTRCRVQPISEQAE